MVDFPQLDKRLAFLQEIGLVPHDATPSAEAGLQDALIDHGVAWPVGFDGLPPRTLPLAVPELADVATQVMSPVTHEGYSVFFAWADGTRYRTVMSSYGSPADIVATYNRILQDRDSDIRFAIRVDDRQQWVVFRGTQSQLEALAKHLSFADTELIWPAALEDSDAWQ
jgi:hypothetical protein